jgi:phosphoglycolate phosphatase
MADARTPPILALWDIDHTLLETRGLGAEFYRHAFERATGRPMEQAAEVTGQTETSILIATLRLHGITEDEPYLSRYAPALAQEYEQHRDQLRTRGRVLPGAREILAALAEAPEIVQSVLSGNLRAVSAAKLNTFDLDNYLDLDVGAYGDDDRDRPALVAIAQARASQRYGTSFARANTVIIGDSTHDINAGRQGGARSIGVASGSDSAEALREAGAEAVWLDLTDTEGIRAALSHGISATFRSR